MKEFDIVIPVGPNDISFIEKSISYNKKNIIGYRNIYIITKNASINIDGCITIDESIFPFNWNDVSRILNNEKDRTGWYLQQLIKLYSGFTIPNILPYYLVIDADTIFLKPTTFFDDNGNALFNIGTEYHHVYFTHMKQLHTTLMKYTNKSGICHHMLFNTEHIKELIEMVEESHNGIFWHIFLEKVDRSQIPFSGASEYEIYFNFMIKYHSDIIKIRKLNWKNSPVFISDSNLDYISIHHHMRK